MDTFFRKHFWVVNLVFILLATWLVARTVNSFVGAALTPATTSVATGSTSWRPPAAPTALDLPRLAQLLGLPLPEPEPVVQEAPQGTPAFDANAAAVKSGLRVKLLGTLVSADPYWSFASVQDSATNKSTTYMVGDELQGAKVMEIERERVIINNNGRKEFIDGEAGSGQAPPVTAAVAPPAAAPTADTAGEGIRQLAENNYEVDRTEIDKTLNDLNEVAMQARIVPAFKDGKAQGFKLFSIRPNSLYSKIGVQNGDVIKRINGFEMNSPEKALEVYTKMKDANRIDIEIERNGSVVRKTYNVR